MAKTDHDKLTDDELISAIDHEVSSADYEGQSEISQQRSEADLAYSGQYTNGTSPTTGMSSILINTLQPAVDTLTTYLTKMFCSDHEAVVFSSDKQEKSEFARMASMRVNEVVFKENNGYKIINRWIKDAALHKNGIVKVVWDDSPVYHKEIFEGSEEELNIHMSSLESEGFTVDIVEEEKVTETLEISDEATGEVLEVSEEFVTYTLKVSKPRDLPKIINIPPEEFLINEGATGINDDQLTRFVAHRQLVYVSDVVKMFPDADEEAILSSSASGYLEHEYETDIRHFFDGTYDQNDYESTQPMMRQVELIECWIRADRDGDGWAEWRHCFSVGRTLLSDEEWFGPIPLCSFTFFPIPHKFYGLGLWDKLEDYHKVKTALVRSAVDSAVIGNTTRFIADPSKVNLKDLKDVRNGIIRALPGFEPDSIVPLTTQGGSGKDGLMLEYIDREVIKQIGIDPESGLVSTDIEKSGNDAAKTSQTIDNASAKVETYGRELAETGMTDMIWTVFDLLVQNGEMPDFDLKKTDIKAKVGLGHQTMAQKLAGVNALEQSQLQMEQSAVAPVAIPAKYKLNLAMEKAKAMMFEDPSMFFPTPEEIEQEQQRQQQVQAQQLEREQNLQATMMQEDADNNEAKRRLEDAKAKEAEAKANAADRMQQLTEEAKVVEIDNVEKDNELNERRQAAQEEQMAANLDMQDKKLKFEYDKLAKESKDTTNY